MSKKWLLIFVAFRISSVYFVRTFHVADEYWQSLEIGHKLVFGYGYTTWEWTHGLRSYLYPSIFAFVYKILDTFGWDSSSALVILPRCTQAVLSAVSDYYFMFWCADLGCDAFWTKMAIFCNWFWYFCASRTIINSFELSLTTIGLYYYPWNVVGSKKDTKVKNVTYVVIACVICVVRPTAATIWVPLAFLNVLMMYPKNWKNFLFRTMLPIGVTTVVITTIIDSFLYLKFVLVPLNFIKFNVFSGLASFYGVHPAHWYLSQGIPVVLGLSTVPFYLQTFHLLKLFYAKGKNSFMDHSDKTIGSQMVVLGVVLLNIILLSAVPHKEFRFILPLTTMMTTLSLKYLTTLKNKLERPCIRNICVSISILGFVIPTFLFGWMHQRGSLELIHEMSLAAQQSPANTSLLFLMPCHSTPLYSHLHVNVSTRFLTCEPPLSASHQDESEDFYKNPEVWLSTHWNTIQPVPTMVACFDVLIPEVDPFLTSKGYVRAKTFHHAIFPEGRMGENIILYGKG